MRSRPRPISSRRACPGESPRGCPWCACHATSVHLPCTFSSPSMAAYTEGWSPTARDGWQTACTVCRAGTLAVVAAAAAAVTAAVAVAVATAVAGGQRPPPPFLRLLLLRASLPRAPPTERERQRGGCKDPSPHRAPPTERERLRCAVRTEVTALAQVIVAIVAVVAVSLSSFCSPTRKQQEAQAQGWCGVRGQGRGGNSQSQICALRGHAPRHRGPARSPRVPMCRVRQAGGTPQVEQERLCEGSREIGRGTQPPHAPPTERERQDGGDKAAPSGHAAQCKRAAAFFAFLVAGSWSTMP